MTLSSVGIEHSDVVFLIPLNESMICSGVIVQTCPRDRGSRIAYKPDYESSLASYAVVPIPDAVYRKAANTSLAHPEIQLVCQQWFLM